MIEFNIPNLNKKLVLNVGFKNYNFQTYLNKRRHFVPDFDQYQLISSIQDNSYYQLSPQYTILERYIFIDSWMDGWMVGWID